MQVLKGGGFVIGVGRKKHWGLLTLVLLLLTPVLASSTQAFHLEGKLLISEAVTNLKPAQFEVWEPIFIQNAEEFASYGFPGNGTESNPYIIERLNISTVGETCIWIQDVDVSFVIRNCRIHNQRTSFPTIRLTNVQNATIEENSIIGGFEGIHGSQTRNLQILDNTICDGASGLSFSNSLNITAEGNSVYRHTIGVALSNTSQCLFSTNRIYGNTHAGFMVDHTSSNNSILSNIFGWNDIRTFSSINAEDNGNNNTWLANAWSDYASPGPYGVSGVANSQDALPTLVLDREAPIINSPDDIVMGEGNDVNVTWYPRDAFPLEYTIRMNAVTLSTGAWFENEYTVNLRNLEPGDYTLTLSVADGSGNTSDDIVEISVLYVIFLDIATELVAYASALSVVLFLVILCLLKKRT
ncbi:MAG: right-handed parallel beta-helix repeat-containing protein [Promethearchaeota archaeon]